MGCMEPSEWLSRIIASTRYAAYVMFDYNVDTHLAGPVSVCEHTTSLHAPSFPLSESVLPPDTKTGSEPTGISIVVQQYVCVCVCV